MRLFCFDCGKSVTNELPNDTIFRATAKCPECLELGAADLLETHAELSALREATRFIPVSEQLPEKETTEQWEMYLCKLLRYGEELVAPLSFVGGCWYSDSRMNYSEWVVSWMPVTNFLLPMPPVEEE
jgi:hypothetical protein